MKAVENIKLMLRNSANELKNFDWNEISDPETIGVWPGPVKLLLVILLFGALLGAGYWFHVKNLQAELAGVVAAEAGLRTDLENKAVLAANLEAYRAQMAEMNESFDVLLNQLPSQTEVPGLLDDIDFTGAGSGLELERIQLQPEVAREFYYELPINIRATGSYHDFGAFVSGVASLSRIVTLHNFTITSGASSDELSLEITAKTYRYNSGDE